MPESLFRGRGGGARSIERRARCAAPEAGRATPRFDRRHHRSGPRVELRSLDGLVLSAVAVQFGVRARRCVAEHVQALTHDPRGYDELDLDVVVLGLLMGLYTGSLYAPRPGTGRRARSRTPHGRHGSTGDQAVGRNALPHPKGAAPVRPPLRRKRLAIATASRIGRGGARPSPPRPTPAVMLSGLPAAPTRP